MSKTEKFIYQLLVFIGSILTVCFGAWWFNLSHIPNNFTGIAHIADFIIFILLTFVVWHQIIMEILQWAIASHIKQYKSQLPEVGLRVAFITTFVPGSESIKLLERTLPAMVGAQYKHDTWLLDEGNSSGARLLCNKYGVKYFTRYGNSVYNTDTGKFKQKTKGGNHNAWYDNYGNMYDFVAQIDTDFIPKNNFLIKTLGYFRDKRVGFVGTPQIYGNTNESFIARGAAEQTYSFYGPILRGLFSMDTALLIGANHVIRVEALKDIDFYKSHITEDLLTGMELHARNWKSVYVPEALAIGEGPNTWASYFTQQTRWAYGCMDILFHHSFRLFKKMTFRRVIYYFFIQQHYFTGLAQVLGILLLTLYFVFGISPTSMHLWTLLILYVPLTLWEWVIALWLQRFNVRPREEKGILLAGKIVSVAVWPIYFIALLSVLTGRRLQYKVTPKGKKGNDHTSLRLFLPQFIIGTVASIDLCLSYYEHNNSGVMIFWAALTVLVMYSLVAASILIPLFIKAYKSIGYYLNSRL